MQKSLSSFQFCTPQNPKPAIFQFSSITKLFIFHLYGPEVARESQNGLGLKAHLIPTPAVGRETLQTLQGYFSTLLPAEHPIDDDLKGLKYLMLLIPTEQRRLINRWKVCTEKTQLNSQKQKRAFWNN